MWQLEQVQPLHRLSLAAVMLCAGCPLMQALLMLHQPAQLLVLRRQVQAAALHRHRRWQRVAAFASTLAVLPIAAPRRLYVHMALHALAPLLLSRLSVPMIARALQTSTAPAPPAAT